MRMKFLNLLPDILKPCDAVFHFFTLPCYAYYILMKLRALESFCHAPISWRKIRLTLCTSITELVRSATFGRFPGRIFLSLCFYKSNETLVTKIFHVVAFRPAGGGCKSTTFITLVSAKVYIKIQ